MKFKFFKNIGRVSRNLFSLAVITAVLAFSALTAAAQKGIVKFDYEYKSNAQGKLKAERERGNKARMYWNKSISRWTVEVDYDNADTDEYPDFNAIADDITDLDDDASRRTRTIVYNYEYKSNAQGKLRAEQNRGKTARMFYNENLHRWTVEVKEPLDISTGSDNVEENYDDGGDGETPTVKRTKSKVNTSADVGSANLPNGATVSYFPNEQMAREIHKAAIKQGDWTKMWYDENRRAWAVAIKVR